MDRNTAGSSTTGRDRRDDQFVYADDFARKINKVTASERSASPTDCLIRRLWRGVEEPVLSGVEETSAVLVSPCAARSFSTTEPELDGPATVFMERCTRNHPVRIAADPAVGLRWSGSSEQHGEDKHRRGSFDSAPQAPCEAVSR
jgi:hypothetical protein